MLPEGWKRTVVSQGISLISGQHVKASLVNSEGKGVPYLTGPADFRDKKIIASNYTQYGHSFCIEDDVLITVKGSGTGKIIRSNGYYAISRQVMAIRSKEYHPNFLYYVILNNIKRYQGASSGLIPGITRDDVLSTPVLFPPLPEQKKIAAILSTWDRAIEGTERLLVNSQQQKKALMQQLLTAKKRLPGFVGEWKSEKLGDICKPQQWVTISSEELTPFGFPVYGANGFIGYCNKFNHECEVVAVSCRGACGDVSFIEGPSYITGNSMCLDDLNETVCLKKFLYYTLKKQGLKNIISGSAQPQIIGKDIRKVSVQLPSLPEQKAIAAVLTTADDEITAIKADLERLRQEKKALMQQLLTGKRRVVVDAEVSA